LQSQFATAVTERDYALAERNARRDERNAARAERDNALAERDTARAERDTALEERDDLQTELDSDNRAVHKVLGEVQQRRDEAVLRRDKIDKEFRESTLEAFRLRETIDTTQAQLETAQVAYLETFMTLVWASCQRSTHGNLDLLGHPLRVEIADTEKLFESR
jgi:chromosome segregation ATPase